MGELQMLDVRKVGPNRVDLTVKGKIEAEEMRQGLQNLAVLSKSVTRGRMLYTLSEFAFPSLGAIGVEMTYLPQLFGLLGKFEKCAVLTDADWIKTAAEIEGRLFPGIEIKAFDMDQITAAEDWLNPATADQ